MAMAVKEEINSGDVTKVEQAEGESYQWDVETHGEGVHRFLA